MKKFNLFQPAFILMIGTALTFIACSKDKDQDLPETFPTSDDLVYSAYSRPLAQTYSEWIDEWIKAVPANACDDIADNEAFATLDKTNRVYFLAGATGVAEDRNISLLPGKAILFPLVNKVTTYPCGYNTGRKPVGTQTVEEFLKQESTIYMNKTTLLEVTIDGLPYSFPNYHRYSTGAFKIFNNRLLENCFHICSSVDQVQDALMDGYWIMLKGLEAGDHVLKIKAEIPQVGLINSVTYNILVR